jgi:hypothetical protein
MPFGFGLSSGFWIKCQQVKANQAESRPVKANQALFEKKFIYPGSINHQPVKLRKIVLVKRA